MLKWVIAAKGGGGDGGGNTKEESTFYRAKLNNLVFRNNISLKYYYNGEK